MRTRGRKLLSLLLALVMVVSLLPTAVLAEDSSTTATWTEVALADIQSTDTIAITMHASYSNKDYVLRNDGGTSTYGPASVWNAATTGDTTWHWNIVATTGGYTIYPAGRTDTWLYCTNANNGLRVGNGDGGTIKTVWSLDAGSGYLKCTDSGSNTRYMGVYDNNGGSAVPTPNFRTYKNTTGNTKDQTLKLYKLTGSTGGETPVSPTPTPTTSVIADGDYVIWTPEYGKALSSTKGGYENYYNVGVDVAETADGKLYGCGSTEVWTVTNGTDGTVTLSQSGKKLGMAGSYTSLNFDQEYETWTITANADGTYAVKNVGRGNTLEYSSYGTWQAGSSVSDKRGDVKFTPAANITTEQPEPDPEPTPTGTAYTLTGSIAAGDTVVMYNAASGMMLSSTASGYKLTGVAATPAENVITTDDATVVWTVGKDTDGNYTFTQGDKVLGMVQSGNYVNLSTDASGGYTGWALENSTTANVFYVQNVKMPLSTHGCYYIEYFEGYTAYSSSSLDDAKYGISFYKAESTAGDLPTVGSQVVIYNQNAGAVLAQENDTQSINKALATIADGKATEIENGGMVFAVEKNGDYYRFKNETYGYLCSNGTGNNAFYCKDFSEEGVSTEDADWLVRECSGGVGGFEMESRMAKFNGRYSQWLEYYSDSFKTYSMYNVTDYSIYSFNFYPVGESVKVQNGVVNDPKVVFTSADTAMKGQDYTLTFYLDDINTIADSSISVKDFAANFFEFEATADGYSALVPASYLDGNSVIFLVDINGEDGGNDTYSGKLSVTIVDEPSIGAVTPAANSQTGENKRPVISAEIFNAGMDATLTMTVGGSAVEATYADSKLTYTPAEDMADGRTTVVVTVKRADDKEVSKTWSFTVGKTTFQRYFGQLHSHTQYSDGSGTLESALSYVEELPSSANVQFVAFTDHSNYFDGSKAGGTANPEGALYDMSLASAESQKLWNDYNASVDAFNAENAGSKVALAGFEMTWSGGPGHINTFNTPGIVSRNNTTLNNKTSDAGMKAYYALLSQEAGKDSLSQFNHPGTTFGNFSDFAYWDAVIDSRMYMVEVGNGEGQIGAGGYYPSYEQYIMALDKGWHVAPTNNQDNHKGKWGNANDARDVILTDNFTEDGIYDAIRDLRMYATEDKNLEIGYTVNDLQMGSSINEVPEKLNFNVTVYDPDSSDSIAKVELVVNSGKVAYTWDDPAALASGELTVTLDPTYSYYFVRVTEGDGDLAVTAPVWVGESLKLGISSVECGTSTPVTDEPLTITTTLFNSESSNATIKSVTYTAGETVLEGTSSGETTVPASGTQTLTFNYTPTVARLMTVTVTVVLTLDGEDYTFTMDVALDVQDASKLAYIGIDASHYNEYVAGNYADSMGNFSKLAAEYGIRTVELKTSEELIAACSNDKYVALIMTAPSRRLAAAQADIKVYTAEEIAAIKAFNAAGGTVILAGWSDHYEYYPDKLTMTADQHMAATQNAVLAELGSSLRISDDATYDDVRSGADGVDAWRLYFNTYGENFLTEGIEVDADHPYDRLYTEVFSHYGGASIYTVDSTLPATVSPVVYGHSSTYSNDMDHDGLGGDSTPKYAYAEGDERLLIMASEQLEGQGLIVVSGAAFMSNFEVQATIEDNGSEKNYSNYRICENLLAYLNPVTITPIAEVQAEEEEGVKFTIEGTVTSNASGYDADTAFFDCIYVQDATAGINAFPVAGNYKLGDVVRITGTTSSYQGERQIAVTSIEKLGETTPVEPKAVTAAQLENQGHLGSLVTVEGTATKIEYANGLIQTIMVKDASGKEARVFIDGYITTARDVENAVVGCHVKATGLASYDNTFTLEDGTPVYQRIRIRNRADVVCTESTDTPDTPVKPGVTPNPGSASTKPTKPAKPAKPALPFTDVTKNDWFYDDVAYVYADGIMSGTGATIFDPNSPLTRGMLVTILYRMAKQPAVGTACAFTDVDVNGWYGKAVIWAAENGIITGYDEATFGPNDNVTREQLATILFRYAVYCGMDAVTLAEYLGGYGDASQITAYAVSAMNWAVGQSLINGSDNGLLLPQAQATRAQVAAIIHRYLER